MRRVTVFLSQLFFGTHLRESRLGTKRQSDSTGFFFFDQKSGVWGERRSRRQSQAGGSCQAKIEDSEARARSSRALPSHFSSAKKKSTQRRRDRWGKKREAFGSKALLLPFAPLSLPPSLPPFLFPGSRPPSFTPCLLPSLSSPFPRFFAPSFPPSCLRLPLPPLRPPSPPSSLPSCLAPHLSPSLPLSLSPSLPSANPWIGRCPRRGNARRAFVKGDEAPPPSGSEARQSRSFWVIARRA